MATYSESAFINLYDDPIAKLKQIMAIVNALDELMLTQIGKGAIKSYTLDDRQVTISRSYGSVKELADSRLRYMQEAERIKQGCEGRISFITPTC